MASNKKILFVDDEDDIREVLQIRLESYGYQVVTASSGQEGLQKVDSEHPDLLILDIMMPGMDGLAVLKKIRKGKTTSNLPVIILTAKQKKLIGDLFEFENIQGFVEKPFESEVLLDLIKKALHE